MTNSHDDQSPAKPPNTMRGEGKSNQLMRSLAFLLPALGLVLTLCFFALEGCSSSTEGPEEEPPSESKERCYDTFNSAIYNIDPTRLGVTTSFDHAVSRLNDWYGDCGKNVPVEVKLKPETQKKLLAFMSAADLKSINAANFSKRDVRHIRNSLLLTQIVKFAPSLTDNELDRVVDLFYYLVRNVELTERAAGSIPLPPFRILLHGRGTAEDRAWLFSGLLRQLRIPTVILRPKPMVATKKKQERDSGPFLVGVLLDEHIYLFDTRLGLPIPGPDTEQEKSPLVRRPATLEEFVSNPAIHKRLNLEKHPYGIRPADLQHPAVQLIGHRSLWSERMKKLNYSFVGKVKPLLFDELDADTDGLITRISEHGHGRWSSGDIGIWPYPESSFRGFEQRTEKQLEELKILQIPLEMPITITKDPKTGAVQISRGTGELRQARIRQLMGKFREAIKLYIYVRGECIFTVEEHALLQTSTQKALETAKEAAGIWIATAKLEQRNEFARTRLEQHIEEYRTEGRQSRQNQAKYLLSLVYRSEGKFNAAPNILDSISDSHPQKHGFALLAARWRRQNPQKSPPAGGDSCNVTPNN